MVKDILYSSRKLKRRRAFKRLFLSLFVLAVAFAGIVGFFYIDKFRIKNIAVTGAEVLDEQKIKETIRSRLSQKIKWLFPADNMLLISKDDLAANLQSEFLRIQEARVDRDWPDTLNIAVKERGTRAVACVKDTLKCFLASSDGILFAESPNFEGNLIFKIHDERGVDLNVGDAILDERELNKIFYFADKMEDKKNIRATEITLKENGVYEINFGDWLLIFDYETDEKTSLNNFLIALEHEIKDRADSLDYVDLRFGNKIFYKFKKE